MADNEIKNTNTNEEEKKKKKGIVGWWLNLSRVAQVAICAVAGAGVVTAVVVPTVIAINNKNSGDTIPETNIDGDFKESIEIKDKKYNGDNLEMTLSNKDTSKEFSDVITITVGNTVLQAGDYTFDKTTGKLTIKKSIIQANKGLIIIKPNLVAIGSVVTEDQWKSALTILSAHDDKSNFKCVSTEEPVASNGEAHSSGEIYVDGYKIYEHETKTDEGVSKVYDTYEFKNEKGVRLKSQKYNDKHYINGMNDTSSFDKHFKDKFDDEINNFSKYTFNTNTKTYSYTKDPSNGSGSKTLEFKFGNDFKVKSFKKISKGEIDVMTFSDYGATTVQLPSFYNEVKTFEGTQSKNIYSTTPIEFINKDEYSENYGMYGEIDTANFTRTEAISIQLSEAQTPTLTNTKLSKFSYWFNEEAKSTTATVTSGVCTLPANTIPEEGGKMFFFAKADSSVTTPTPYNIYFVQE